MPLFLPEPPYTHGQASQTGVLLVNLGSPKAPTSQAVRAYLRPFLSDPRVVEIPRALWWFILNGLILPFRSPKSARKYQSVWTDEGPPLLVHTANQAKLLQGYWGEAGLPSVHIAWAMRYGDPGIGATLSAMKKAGCTRILIVPLYPQYAASTGASVTDEVCRWLEQTRNQPEIRFVRSFCDDPGYIAALADRVRAHWIRHGRGEKLLVSFHGLPQRSLELGDPYFCECHKTARLLAAALELRPDQWGLSFQSRFGKARWLEPYTEPTLVSLAQGGIRKVDVFCPGFVSDCLETLEEIEMECKAAFLAAGGSHFSYISCLNESDAWIEALCRLVHTHLGHWLTRPLPDPHALAEQAERARLLGASA
jgi:protoporphyrin/coproporphyrin ferrochelatase